MAVTFNTHTGDGTTGPFPFTFEYINETDVKVSIDGITQATTEYTFPTASTIQFTTQTPDATKTIRIFRDTDIDDLKATFFAGSAIRAQDLNSNFEQNNFAVQEVKTQYVTKSNGEFDTDVDLNSNKLTNVAEPTAAQDAATKNYVDTQTWSDTDETISSGETWASNDDRIATTAAIDGRVDEKIDTAITTDITGSDGIVVSENGTGRINITIQDGGIGLDEIALDSLITNSESQSDINGDPDQDSGDSSLLNDSRVLTGSASEHRYRNWYQQATPSSGNATNPVKGQFWLRPGADPADPNSAQKTLSMWNGTNWIPIASGGTFTNQPTTIYVDRYSGDDVNNDGRRIINQVRTIKRALELANDGDLISIAPGVYQEQLPLDITQKNLSIVGDSIRSVFVQPMSDCESSMQDPYQTMEGGIANPDYWDPGDPTQQNEVDAVMFRVNSGTYIANMTFVGMKADTTGPDPHPIDPYVAELDANGNPNQNANPTGLPSYQGWIIGFLPGAKINKSPYIQNCTNFTDSGINNLVEYDPTPNDEANAPGFAGDESSDFTGGGIIVDGAKVAHTSKLRSMVADSFTQVGLKGPGIFVTNNGYTQLTSSYSFFGHYHLKAHNGGQANLAASTTDFGDYALVADGKSPTSIFTATAPINGYQAGDTTLQLASIGNFTIGDQGQGVPSENMVIAIGNDIYPITNYDSSNNTITIFRAATNNASLNAGLATGVNGNYSIPFYFRSMVASSGHTMEYAGSGTDYSALPENGGRPDESKQITEINNGKIWAVIVDHKGKFKAGDFEVDQQSGSVSLPDGALGIPLLIETLDTDTQVIESNTSGGTGIQIGSNVDLNTYKIVGLGTPSQNTDAATKGYVDTEVAANATDIATNTTNISNNTTAIGTKLPLAGGTMSGNIDLGSNNLQNVGNLLVDNVQVNNNLTVDGGLTVRGLFTQVDSQILKVADKNIEIGAVSPNFSAISGTVSGTTITVDSTSNLYVGQTLTKQSGTGDFGTGAYISSINSSTQFSFTYTSGTPVNGDISFTTGGATDFTADGAGITVHGTTDKTFNWIDSTDSWTSSEHIDLASGKDFKIAGSSVLSGTTLGSGVTDSSLTSVGTITSGTWSGSTIAVDKGGTGTTTAPTNGQLLIGSTGAGYSVANLTAGTNVNIANSSGAITVSSTDTTYTAGDGLALSVSDEFSVNLNGSNSGLEFSGGKLQVDDSVARTTGDTFTGDLILSETAGVLSTLAFKELASIGSNYVGFKAPNSIASDVTWTLPDADGSAAQILSTDGAGTLYWQTPPLKGSGGDLVFFENDTNVTTNYTITSGKNAMSAGPITVNAGVTVTIPSGSAWTVV